MQLRNLSKNRGEKKRKKKQRRGKRSGKGSGRSRGKIPVETIRSRGVSMRGKKKLKEWKTLSGIEREKGFWFVKLLAFNGDC